MPTDSVKRASKKTSFSYDASSRLHACRLSDAIGTELILISRVRADLIEEWL